MKLWLDFSEEKSLKQRMDFQQSQCKKALKLWPDLFGRGKKFETTDGFPTIPVQKSVETMARFLRGKKFATTDGFPTIPVPKSVETMTRFGKGKQFETTDGFPTISVQTSVETMARFV